MTMLIRIDRYLRATGMSPTRFGKLTVNDPRLVTDLKRGRQPGRAIVSRVEKFMAERREDGA